jgi:hypothetical protein
VHALDELIASSPVFAGMPEEQLALIAGCARTSASTEARSCVPEGDEADTFYLVRRGRVAFELHTLDRGGLVIETADPGDVVGWSWLFPPYRWHSTRATEEVRAIAFDGACLRGKCDEDARLGYELMQRFAQVMIDRSSTPASGSWTSMAASASAELPARGVMASAVPPGALALAGDGGHLDAPARPIRRTREAPRRAVRHALRVRRR